MGIDVAMLMIAIGFVLVLIGMLLIILSIVRGISVGGKENVEFGGGVLIGPIPIAFGTSSRALLIASILLLVVMVIALIMMLAVPHLLR